MPAIDILSPLNLGGNEMRNWRPQELAADPDPSLCQFYRSSVNGKLRFYNAVSAAWETLQDSSVSSGVSSVTASQPLASTGGSDPVISIRASTPSQSGYMSAADKAKLDTVETGAKDDQNAAEVPFAAAGTLVASNVQGAIEELDTKKAITGHTHDAATTSIAGFMSAADKTKLNGIAAGATGDQTASTVPFTPAGDIAANNVQAAIQELDTEKASAGHSHTDATTMASGFMSGADKTKLNGIAANADVSPVQSVNGQTGAVSLGASDVGAATEAYVTSQIDALVNGAPGALDTLQELADALGNDPNFATTITNDLALKTDRFAASVGNGVATSFVLTHNLNSRDVIVQVRANAAPYAMKLTTVEMTTVNTVTVYFSTAPSTDQYRVVIIG
jgi:hypothetical protein